MRTGELMGLLFLVHKFFVLDCFIPGAEGKVEGVTFLLVVCSIRMRGCLMNHSSKVSSTMLNVKVSASQLVSPHAGLHHRVHIRLDRDTKRPVRVCIWSSRKQPRCTSGSCITNITNV